jgi:uncharacterized repeat protein (TIGR03803 family)
MRKLGFGEVSCIVAIFCVAPAGPTPAQILTTLASFDGSNGNGPYLGSLVQGTDGKFFGTTQNGGRYNYGEIFAVSPTGTLGRIYSFCEEKFVCPDGQTPYGSVMQAANGSFYGTTAFGGANDGGTLFELTPAGALTTLYSFPNESTPQATLVQGFNGYLYGSANAGGVDVYGTIFAVNPTTGTLTTVYTFCSKPHCVDGTASSGLVLAPNGNFYGSTGSGGTHGNGSVFELAPSGRLTTLYSFNSSTDGQDPSALVLATDGNLYGTAVYGGPYNGGTVFKITPTGQFTNLHNFCSQTNCADGEQPMAALVQGTDGNLYGTTPQGGTGGAADCVAHCGTAFQITTSGTLTTLYNFCSQTNCTDGLDPYYGLVQGTDGNFYGATIGGGTGGAIAGGTIYSLSMGLGSFVQANPSFGRIGQAVNILGNNLTGTTSVFFNDASAEFEVVSDTYIRATVPTGASTDVINVVTPSGVLSSNVAFQVLP